MVDDKSIDSKVKNNGTSATKVGIAMLYSLFALGVFAYCLSIGQSKGKEQQLQDSIRFEYNFKKAIPEVITLDSVYFAKRDSMKRVYENNKIL